MRHRRLTVNLFIQSVVDDARSRYLTDEEGEGGGGGIESLKLNSPWLRRGFVRRSPVGNKRAGERRAITGLRPLENGAPNNSSGVHY